METAVCLAVLCVQALPLAPFFPQGLAPPIPTDTHLISSASPSAVACARTRATVDVPPNL